MIKTLALTSIWVWILFIICTGFNKFRWNAILQQTIIKVYLLYWVLLVSSLMTTIFSKLWSYLDFYIIELINIRINSITWFIIIIIVFVSSCVNINSIDYLSIMDNLLFIIYISIFQLSMIAFVMSNDLIIQFMNWDLLGIISYLLINYWSSKLNAGIKAIVFNKIGDIFYLLLMAWSYSLLINIHSFFSITILFSFFINYSFLMFYSGIYSIPILIIMFSKSAQLPFFSWLLNAMNAPTPISSLLHSSTMVIAGVYLGLIINETIILLIDINIWFSFCWYHLLIITLIWSLLRAICVTDIKSIIAFSTVSQISYMFLAIVFNPLLCLLHILIHALFKSLLFLLAGCIIIVQSNSQSIYRMKINHYFIKIIFIMASIILILSISKEVIIHSIYYCLSSQFVFYLSFLGSVFTIIYSFKIYIYSFYYSITSYSSYYSFILPFYIISSLLIDEIFRIITNQGSFSLFYSIDYESVTCFFILDSLFSIPTLIISFLVIYSFIFNWLLIIGNYWSMVTNHCLLIIYYQYYIPFHSTTSFTIPIYQDFFLFFSSYLIKGPINWFEVFTGLNSCFSLYHCLLFSVNQWFIFWLLLIIGYYISMVINSIQWLRKKL